MPKKLIRKYLPDPVTLKGHRIMRVFGRLIHDPNLFHLNRRSVSGSVFVGLLCALLPIFPQMLTSAALAIVLRVNLPISVGLVWITNPFTIPPIFYACYRIGAWLLGEPTRIEGFRMSPEWIESVFGQIWQPLLLGGLVCGLISGALGFILVRLFWRWHVLNDLAQRRARRKLRHQSQPAE
ncbi:MAG: DUF2062 domain-containing protein [Gammaproteobacteria bacterium SHHR-1]|uniref:DUF2062 domain-containing protein n=1 Tax=Magnetovirga frankeli TaxID=947516 RepID=UPI00129347C1|nr:DUF2062 domain-containing protein [gamma proteobacterium SS-5]